MVAKSKRTTGSNELHRTAAQMLQTIRHGDDLGRCDYICETLTDGLEIDLERVSDSLLRLRINYNGSTPPAYMATNVRRAFGVPNHVAQGERQERQPFGDTTRWIAMLWNDQK